MFVPPSFTWTKPAVVPALAAGEIHLWSAWLDEPGWTDPALSAALSFEERARAATFRFEPDRRHSLATRVVLRHLLARYRGIAAATPVFTYGPHGKPALAASGAPPLHFNLSHAGSVALFAFAVDRPLGVDLEEIRPLPDLPQMEQRLFAVAGPDEPPGAQPGDARTQEFYRRWTAWEATGKFHGDGLLHEPVGPTPDHLAAVDPADGYLGCLAYDGANAKLRCHHASPVLFTAAENLPTASRPGKLPGLPHRQGRPLNLCS